MFFNLFWTEERKGSVIELISKFHSSRSYLIQFSPNSSVNLTDPDSWSTLLKVIMYFFKFSFVSPYLEGFYIRPKISDGTLVGLIISPPKTTGFKTFHPAGLIVHAASSIIFSGN